MVGLFLDGGYLTPENGDHLDLYKTNKEGQTMAKKEKTKTE